MVFPSLPRSCAFSSRDKQSIQSGFNLRGTADRDEHDHVPKGEASHKVLIIDNNPISRSTIARSLREWGYAWTEAASFAEALEIISNESPAVIIVDLDLPDIAGFDVLNSIKQGSPNTVLVVASQTKVDEISDTGVQLHLRKPINEAQLRAIFNSAISPRSSGMHISRSSIRELKSENRTRLAGKPQAISPLGKLIQNAMQLLGLSYQQIVSESKRLAVLSDNPDMRIGKSTLGNIIGGTIRQPSTAKLDSLRIILHLSRDDLDLAIGLAPERRFAEQLEIRSRRTHEVTYDAVTRQRTIRVPVLRPDANLTESQFLGGIVERWTNVEVEYLGSFFPPYLRYVVIGENDTHASPVAPPGTRVLVNTLMTQVGPAENTSFHERELYCILTADGMSCCYLERTSSGKMISVPHPLSGRVREEFKEEDITVVGQVIGLLFRN